MIDNSILSSNREAASGTVLNNSIFIGNAGSIGSVRNSTLNNYTLTANTAVQGGAVLNCILNNCVLLANVATSRGGGAYECVMNNCILFGNSALGVGGGALVVTTATNRIINSILYHNGPVTNDHNSAAQSPTIPALCLYPRTAGATSPTNRCSWIC